MVLRTSDIPRIERTLKKLLSGSAVAGFSGVGYARKKGMNTKGRRVPNKFKTKSKSYSKKKVSTVESVIDKSTHSISKSSCSISPKSKSSFAAKVIKETPPLYELWNDNNTSIAANHGQQVYIAIGRTQFDNSMLNSMLSTYDTGIEKRIFIEYISQVWCFTNLQITPVEITIWNLVCKKDAPVGNDPITTIQTGIDMRYSANSGLVSQTGTPNAAAYVQPYTNPNESVMFKDSWKVVKQTRIVLGPGQMHKHTYFRRINRIWDSAAQYFGTSSGQNYFKNLSGFALLTCNGQTNSIGSWSSSPTTASQDKVGIAQTCRTQVKWRIPISSGNGAAVAGYIASTLPTTGITYNTTQEEATANPTNN